METAIIAACAALAGVGFTNLVTWLNERRRHQWEVEKETRQWKRDEQVRWREKRLEKYADLLSYSRQLHLLTMMMHGKVLLPLEELSRQVHALVSSFVHATELVDLMSSETVRPVAVEYVKAITLVIDKIDKGESTFNDDDTRAV